MSLSDDIRGFRDHWQPHMGPSCKIGLLLDLMPEDDADAFKNLLTSQIYGTDIAKLVQSWSKKDGGSEQFRGIAAAVSGESIQRHRRGGCACCRRRGD